MYPQSNVSSVFYLTSIVPSISSNLFPFTFYEIISGVFQTYKNVKMTFNKKKFPWRRRIKNGDASKFS
jgi:hypothetical protein